MSEPENKDKIKEILEGHNKKFTPLELIVGIIVILIIGSGIGYAIFKLLTPSPTPPPRAITEIQQPQVPPVNEEENSSVEQPKVKTSSEKQLESVENKQSETNSVAAASNSNAKPTTESEEGEQIEGNTQKSSSVISTVNNETEVSTKPASEQAGPKIIPPKSETEAKTKVNREVKKGFGEKAAEIKESVKSITNKKTVRKGKLAAFNKPKRVSRRVKRRKKGHLGVYVLQVSSNKNRKLAILTVIKLRKCGHKAYTKEVSVKGEKYTRVYVGPIKGYSAAKLEAKEIKRQLHLGYTPIIKRDD